MTIPSAAHETDMASLQTLGAELIARDRWSRERLLAFQQERLRELIAYAAGASPYYREAFGSRLASVADVRLDRLPTLPKTTLVDQFDRIVTDPRVRLAALEDHLRGPDPGGLFEDSFRIFSTSGTSGLRALVVYSEAEFQFWVAVSLRLFARIGITPQTRVAAIGAPNPLHITRRLFAAFRSGRSGAPELSVLTPLDETVAALNDYQPEAVITYASIAALLAQEQLEGRLRIAPQIVGVSAEVLTDEARRWIDSAWAVQPTEVYASTETLYIASSTPPHRGLQLFEDLAIVEVVDENNRPVPHGTPGYKVLVTNLVNRTQPLIRYELSDSATFAEGPDPSGLPYRRLAAVDGRSDDILRFAGAGGGEVAVHPYRLRTPFAAFAELRQYQIVQHERRLEVRIVLQPAAPADTVARVGAALRNALEEGGAVSPPIDVVPVDAIEREPGHAAKLKLVKRLTST
jgi:phenylacetate-CoA ligase